MRRRGFLGTLGAGALAGTWAPSARLRAAAEESVEWRMVTTWPKGFPGLGTGADYFADLVERLSGGRLRVKVYGAGELVDAFGTFDLVADGGAELGHGTAMYWKGKVPAAQFFTAVPFGLTAQEMNAWLYRGGGLELWRETYAPFGLVPLAGGNSGVQMAGWFNQEIASLDDIRGLKMRLPGIGGEALARAGGTPVTLPGAEVFTALQTGVIDAAEWVGPYNDLALGLHEAAKYYYYPGWQEPGAALELLVNRSALQSLPDDLRDVVEYAARVANQDMLAEFTAQNNRALQTLVERHGVALRRLPDEVLRELRSLSDEVVAGIAEGDAMAGKVHASYRAFRDQAMAWHDISERAYLNARAF